MRMQIVSDVHLEFRLNQFPHIPRRAPHIALLGDIGSPLSHVYRRFLTDLSRRFTTVIVVAGNHEYYSTTRRKTTVGEVREHLRKLCASFPNVHFLDNNVLLLEGVRILGATLWTSIPPEMWRGARKHMSDYSMCYVARYDDMNAGVPLSPENTTHWHEETVAWIKEELHAPGYRDTPTVILTHHAPYTHGTSDPRFNNNLRQCCYSTDLSALFASPVVAWAYGHTHYPFDKCVNGVRLVSNPVGYPEELASSDTSIRSPPIIII